MYCSIWLIALAYTLNTWRNEELPALSLMLLLLLGLTWMGIAFCGRRIHLSKREHTLTILDDETCEVSLTKGGAGRKYGSKLIRRNKNGDAKIYSGILGCKVLGFISGHTLVLPEEITRDPDFKEFLNRSNL